MRTNLNEVFFVVQGFFNEDFVFRHQYVVMNALVLVVKRTVRRACLQFQDLLIVMLACLSRKLAVEICLMLV